MNVNQHRLQAYFNQFTWLSKYIPLKDVLEVKVSRVNSELLGKQPRVAETGFIFEEYERVEQLFLLDEQGEILVNVGVDTHTTPADPTYRFWKFWRSAPGTTTTTWNKDSVSDALEKLGERSGLVHYILFLYSNNVYTAPNCVTIFKGPRGFTLANWAEQLNKAARNAVLAQITAAEQQPTEME